MSEKLPNYLRTYRKRSGFSQREVAFLLGSQYGTKVSRYERNVRLPNLETALALAVIFQAPSSRLFEGIYRQVELKTYEQAELLADWLSQRPSTPAIEYKRASLERIYVPDLSAPPLGGNQQLP